MRGAAPWFVAGLAFAVVGACTSGPASTPASSRVTVFAAASLKAALTGAASAYQRAAPGTTLTISTDASSALETKIEQGAPADLFLSADAANPQKLVDAGLADGAVVPFAGNRLTVIVPTGDPGHVATPKDLARPRVKVVAAGDGVPITKYAMQLVQKLASQPGYPADFAARYAANIVSREDSVAAVVAKIAQGEGDAAIVYVTDAGTSNAVVPVAVPDDANVRATYAGVVVKASHVVAAARALLGWLTGPDGQAVLASFGFLPA
jgi:molybdate transport system substrate-binding protein